MIRETTRFLIIFISVIAVALIITRCAPENLESFSRERVPPRLKAKHITFKELVKQPEITIDLTKLSIKAIAKSSNLEGIQIDTTG